MAMITVGIPLDHAHPGGMVMPQFIQDRAFAAVIETAGALPLFIPTTESEATLRAYFEMCDALCIPGGDDVDPRLYDEEQIMPLRLRASIVEACEVQLTRWALDADMPILAICRGHQLLNVVRGGTLWQDIYLQNAATLEHKKKATLSDPEHDIAIDRTSRLFEILSRETLKVNSSHHQAVRELGTNLRITATSSDGIVEAIEATDKSFVLGVQFHPECLTANTDWALSLFTALVEGAKAPIPR
jgi:putative glutamine amidotransferase